MTMETMPRAAYDALLADMRDMKTRAEAAEAAYRDLWDTVSSRRHMSPDDVDGWLDRVLERVDRQYNEKVQHAL